MKILSSISVLAIILYSSAFSDAQAQSNKVNKSINNVSPTYASLHSPTFNSTVIGSPTIQQNEESFYDASQNPDYLSVQNLGSADGVSEDYFVADYDSYLAAKVIAESAPAPQVNNNYYGYGDNLYGYRPYCPSLFPTASSSVYGQFYLANSLYSTFGYGVPYGGYGYYDSFYNQGFGYYNSFYNRSYGYYDPFFYPSYLNSYNYVYSPSPSFYYGGYNSYASYNNGSNTQIDNVQSINRSSVSYYANRSYTDIRRRDNYQPGSTNTKGGRAIANDRRTTSNGNNSATYVSRRSQRNGGDVVKRRRSVAQSSGTIQDNNNPKRGYRTNNNGRTVTSNRSNGDAVSRNSTVSRQSRNYVSRSSNGRSTNVHRSTNRQSVNNSSSRQTRTGYSSHSPSRSSNRSSYRPTRSSAPSRSYSPRSSSSGGSRSYSAPSRSRSSSPSRSVSRSSSSSSSRGSSSGRKH